MSTNAVLRDPAARSSPTDPCGRRDDQCLGGAAAAFNNHVPRPIIFIIILCTLVGAFLFGLTFGYAGEPHALLSAIFCLLFAGRSSRSSISTIRKEASSPST